MPAGIQWLTIPVDVKGKYTQRIRDTVISDSGVGATSLADAGALLCQRLTEVSTLIPFNDAWLFARMLALRCAGAHSYLFSPFNDTSRR
jgi:hypothetical protein